jgi:hypothetical protein
VTGGAARTGWLGHDNQRSICNASSTAYIRRARPGASGRGRARLAGRYARLRPGGSATATLLELLAATARTGAVTVSPPHVAGRAEEPLPRLLMDLGILRHPLMELFRCLAQDIELLLRFEGLSSKLLAPLSRVEVDDVLRAGRDSSVLGRYPYNVLGFRVDSFDHHTIAFKQQPPDLTKFVVADVFRMPQE